MPESSYRIEQKPFYLPIRDEVEVFERAWAEQIPLLSKARPVAARRAAWSS